MVRYTYNSTITLFLAPMTHCAKNGRDLQSHQYLNWNQHFSRYRNINPLFLEHLAQCIIHSYIKI